MWYLFTRALQMLVILAILSAALFGLLSSMPGNPVDLMITSNPQVKPEDVLRLKRLRGLDKPWYVQYVRWLWGYAEPARPPVILAIDRNAVISNQDRTKIELDLSDYVVDPNFVPSNDALSKWLSEIWPTWTSSKEANEIKAALALSDVSQVLLSVAGENTQLQNQMVRLIEKESAKGLVVTGLLGAKANGLILSSDLADASEPYLWFTVTNRYGQERIGRLALNNQGEREDLVGLIDPQVVEDEQKTFTVDLRKFLVNKAVANEAVFSLIDGSPGDLSDNGTYTHLFKHSGQSTVLAKVAMVGGASQSFAFNVEHGVIGRNDKFNRGFLYFFVGDKNALGFSQTYKRPVYELLFGEPPVCGDGKIESGETCDDGNRHADDGCGPDCFRKSDTFLQKADAIVSGYIVRSGRIGNTVQLMLPALLLSLLFAIPLGVFSAYRQYSAADYVINFLAFVGISLPVFWFGIMMIYVFAESLQLFPAGGVQTPGIYGEGTFNIVIDRLKHAILPTLVLSIFYVGQWLRYMRASMLEVLPKDYIRTARAKGLSERVVILKHAFRNALIPVVTVLALSIPSLFSGAVLTETVFSWPGIGRLQYEAVMNSDYYVAIIVFLVAAILVMVGNLLADTVYILVDPRIREK